VLVICGFGFLFAKLISMFLDRKVTFLQGISLTLLILIGILVISFSSQLIGQILWPS
jgi:hypothetical protein